MTMLVDLLVRYGALLLLALLTAIMVLAGLFGAGWSGWLLLLLPLTGLGIRDLLQRRHTLLRNYPLVGHLRWLFELTRPYLRQYIVEGDLSGRPYNREQRSLVYERAKNTVDSQPFGTDFDVYDNQYELMTHSIRARVIEDTDFRVRVGGPQCSQPYEASLLNISAMSFGALGGRAIEALNLGARRGGCYHDTGEGGISPYHRRHGGDLVWEIGTGYFGCRDRDGNFDVELFEREARSDQVRMIEIKLSQGAKPGHGGVLPGRKVTAEIARARHVPEGVECVSPPAHSAFSTPVELLEFVALLREGLVLVRNALVGTGLRSDIRIAASGKVYSAFSMARNLALGADWCNAARAFMFTLGCVMSKKCHTDRCPTGVATQNPYRQRGLVIDDKAWRVAHFHRNTLKRLGELIGAAGLGQPGDLRPHHLHHRTGPNSVATMDRIKEFLEPGILLEDPDSTPYADWWAAASADSFQPQATTGPRQHRGVAD